MEAIPLQAAQLYKDGSTLRLGLHMRVKNGRLKAVFDEGFQPLVAWRSSAETGCVGNLLQWTAGHVCLAVGNAVDPIYQAILPTSDPSGSPLALYATYPFIPLSCNEHLLVGSNSVGVPYVRDLESGLETWIQPSVGRSFDARLAGEHLLLVVEDTSGANVKLTGWIWNRPNTLEQIVDPGSEVIYDMRSDGQTLVWVQVSSAALGTLAPGTLWTSPFATSAAEVKGTARRATPPMYLAESSKTANQGFYALIDQTSEGNDAERHVHVYRLSDARHWAVPQISDVKPSKMIYIDSEEVWYLGATLNGATSTIIRQRLDALGPGD
jgi:hypothetical protein